MQAGMDGLHRGRKLGAADLQLLLLALLAERPSHGYELIKALDERSKGYYSPSPGMVYPALTYLEEIGYASVEAQGTKKLYSVTVAGLSHLEEQRANVDALLEQLAWIGSRMDDVRQAMAGADAPDDAGDFDSPHAFFGRGRGRHAAGAPEVRAARRSLKSALIEKSGATVEEQRRIAKVLERAAAEIRGKSNDTA
ncbi:MAG: PadR family transcriptional regulator [Caldimonas sp.]